MSLIRALSKELQARSDDSLRGLVLRAAGPHFSGRAGFPRTRRPGKRRGSVCSAPWSGLTARKCRSSKPCTCVPTPIPGTARPPLMLKKTDQQAPPWRLDRKDAPFAAGAGPRPPGGAPARSVAPAAQRSSGTTLPVGSLKDVDRYLSGRAGTQLHRTRAGSSRPLRSAWSSLSRNSTAAARPSPRLPPRRWKPPCRCSTGPLHTEESLHGRSLIRRPGAHHRASGTLRELGHGRRSPGATEAPPCCN
jgi:hypothetical protein